MKKINVDEILFKLIIFFPISIILQGIGIFNSMNKVLIFLILALLIIKNIKKKVRLQTIFVIFTLSFLYVFSIIFTKKSLDNVNDVFYFALWVLFFLYLIDNDEMFRSIMDKNIKYMYKIIIMWNTITFISFFFTSSYIIHWGGDAYFKSFSNGEHRFASTCIFIMALTWIIARKENKRAYMIFSIIPIIGIYMSGARTYLVVILVFLLCIYYLMCNKKTTFYITLIPMLFFMIIAIAVTPMGKKFVQTTTMKEKDFLATITNSRSIFWKADIKAFFELDFLQQLVGNGYNFVYDVNESAVKLRIYAHNDIINILLTYGYIGVYTYMYVFIKYSRKKINNANGSKIIKYGYYFIWFFNAMFNMVYTYIGAVFSLPFILYSLIDFEKNISKDKTRCCDEMIG